MQHLLRDSICFAITLGVIAVGPLHANEVSHPSSDAQDGKYSVKLTRPFSDGQIYSYAALGGIRESTVVSWAGGILEKEEKEYQCEIAAVARIHKVDETGMPSHITYRVHRFRKRHEGEETELVEDGVEIDMIISSEDVVFLIEGEELSGELHEALSLVLKKPDHEEDSVFGTSVDRSPGDRWPVKKDLALARFRTNGIDVDPDKLGALVTFDKLTRMEDAECMQLKVEMKATDAGPAMPQGFEVKEGFLEVLVTTTVPLDSSIPAIEESTKFSLRSEASGQAGDQKIDVKTELSRTFRARLARFGS